MKTTRTGLPFNPARTAFSGCLLFVCGACAGTADNKSSDEGVDTDNTELVQKMNSNASETSKETETGPADTSQVKDEATTDGARDGIQYFGRWDFSDPQNPSASWGAVYFTTKFTGTSLTLEMTDPNNDFQYKIDGGEMKYLSPGNEREHVLTSDLEDTVHTLEFYRRSGGSFGRTTIHGVILDDGATLMPTKRPVKKIEIVGDSISVGYGNEGMGSTSRATENGYEAYGPQLARIFGAQWSVIAHSGQGMVRNLGEAKDSIADGVHMPDEFKMNHFPSSIDDGEWDFSNWQPDVLIVTLGTNDFSWPQWDQDPGPAYELTQTEYVEGYQDFLEFARSVYPETHIFAVGTFISNATNQFGRANNYICQAVSEVADAQMYCIDPGFTGETWLSGGDDYIGDWTHPTVEGHSKIAEQLALQISTRLGW